MQLARTLAFPALLFTSLASAEVPQARFAPVTQAARGFPAEEARAIQESYDPQQTPAARDQTLYMYLNMAQFFPHQVVSRSGSIRELPVAPNPKIGGVVVRTALGELSLDDMLKDPRSRVQGYIVVHRGRIVYEQYPGMRPNDNHLWWSASKTLAGLLAAQLVAEGRLDADQPVEHYLPEFATSGWKGTPVRDLADQASGINAEDLGLESYSSPKSELSRLIFAERILTPPVAAPALGHRQALMSMTRKRPPGEAFEYSSANTNMLGLLLERVTGQRYADLVTERIWSRIGAEGDAMAGLTPEGDAIAHGMFSSRLRDMARFGMAFTPSGKPLKKSAMAAVPDAVLDMIQHGGRHKLHVKPQKLAAMVATFGEEPIAYSWQWDAVFKDGDLYKSGFHGQGIYVSPAHDAVVAVFSTSNERAEAGYARAIVNSGLLK
ncbi:MAG: serine hydrolase domain-containing protein [Nevskiales bacterium]